MFYTGARETERSEASELHIETQAKQIAFEDQGYEAWISWHPCPDGRQECPRCGVDFATYLANKAVRVDAST